MLTINSAGISELKLPVTSPQSPTALPPEFAFSTSTIDDDGLSWVDGEWAGAWDTVSGVVEALSPTIGNDDATVTLESGTTYDVWIRYIYGGNKQPVEHVGVIYVR